MSTPIFITRSLKATGIVGAWVAVIAIGRAVRPSESEAATGAVALPPTQVGAPNAPRGVIVGTLEGTSHRITIRATPEGPRYDVAGADGAPIAQTLDAATLGVRFPDLDVRSLHSSDHVQLMSAEEVRDPGK